VLPPPAVSASEGSSDIFQQEIASTPAASTPAANTPAPAPAPAPEELTLTEVEIPAELLEQQERVLLLASEDANTIAAMKEYTKSEKFLLHTSVEVNLIGAISRIASPRLVILDARCSGFTDLHKAVYHWPMQFRLASIVLLLSPNIKSEDSAQAFAQSVDMVVNLEDMARFGELVGKALAEKADFLKRWNLY
jgi:hypothetical protein